MKRHLKYLTVFIAFLTLTLIPTGFTVGSTVYVYNNSGEPLTKQIWAVQVEAEPGESGTLSRNFEAAYGPYDSGPLEGKEVKKDSFGFKLDDSGYPEVVKGDEYVGNYFHIEQESGTSGGTTRRYIDISSPWSHAYVYEEATIVGSAYITDSFNMINLTPGAEAVSNWYELF